MQFSLSNKKIALHNNKHFMANSKAYFFLQKTAKQFLSLFCGKQMDKKRNKTEKERSQKEAHKELGKREKRKVRKK